MLPLQARHYICQKTQSCSLFELISFCNVHITSSLLEPSCKVDQERCVDKVVCCCPSDNPFTRKQKETLFYIVFA